MDIQPVLIGDKLVGHGYPCMIVGEIGINHNGDIEIAKKLIDAAVECRFDAVKFQKRTVEIVYSDEELARPRESPFGSTNGDLKYGLEFGDDEYLEIDRHCRLKGIMWFCSVWDEVSVEFCMKFNPPCFKIPSACLTDHDLLRHLRSTGRPVILSTGMSTMEEIDTAMEVLRDYPVVILHCTSTYPSAEEEINLAVIDTLKQRFRRPTGYSGHEPGIPPSVMAAIAYDACVVERHITLNRAMWGTDQSASLEPRGMEILSKYIRLWPKVRGDGQKRVYPSELQVRSKLRRRL